MWIWEFLPDDAKPLHWLQIVLLAGEEGWPE